MTQNAPFQPCEFLLHNNKRDILMKMIRVLNYYTAVPIGSSIKVKPRNSLRTDYLRVIHENACKLICLVDTGTLKLFLYNFIQLIKMVLRISRVLLVMYILF